MLLTLDTESSFLSAPVAARLWSIVRCLHPVKSELRCACGDEIPGKLYRLPGFVGWRIKVLAKVRRCSAILHRVQPPPATTARLIAIAHQSAKRRNDSAVLASAVPVIRNNTARAA
jgi:hypothetical protein